MAKKKPKKLPAEVLTFLADLTKDPNRLGRFIQDPWRFLKKQKIKGKPIDMDLWEPILRVLAHEIMDDLLNAAECYEH
jgi:hypothetical protein